MSDSLWLFLIVYQTLSLFTSFFVKLKLCLSNSQYLCFEITPYNWYFVLQKLDMICSLMSFNLSDQAVSYLLSHERKNKEKYCIRGHKIVLRCVQMLVCSGFVTKSIMIMLLCCTHLLIILQLIISIECEMMQTILNSNILFCKIINKN